MLVNIDVDKVKQLRASVTDGTVKVADLDSFLKEIELQLPGVDELATEKNPRKPRNNLKKERMERLEQWLLKPK